MNKAYYTFWLAALLTLALAMIILACSGARAPADSLPHAQEISGPAGVRCFAITDGTHTYGGNCYPN